VKGLSRRLWFLLPGAGLAAGCEILAGIDNITYSPDAGLASSGNLGSTGSVQTSGDGEQASGATGSPDQSGTAQQSGSGTQADEDGTAPPMPEASSSGSTQANVSGATTGSGSGSSAGSGSGSVKDSGLDATVEASSPAMRDSSTADVNRLCIPGSASGQLPFVVDSEYQPTGDYGTGTTTTSAVCTVARSSATAKGNCHTATYTVVAGGAFAGVFWQYNFDWGTEAGYEIPAGATKLTFSAMGAAGGEKVTFNAGYTGPPTAATPCTDTIRGSTNTLTLTTTWTAYSMTLSGGYPEGVLGAFAWEANAPGAAGTSITFYVDDIQYQ
jgi:hypothetical protein